MKQFRQILEKMWGKIVRIPVVAGGFESFFNHSKRRGLRADFHCLAQIYVMEEVT